MVGDERALRINRDRDWVQLPVMGLQEAGGNLSKLLASTFAAGKFRLSPSATDEVKDRLVDILGCLARICGETALLMETVTARTAPHLETPADGLEPHAP